MLADIIRERFRLALLSAITCSIIIAGMTTVDVLQADDGAAQPRWQAISEKEKFLAEIAPVNGNIKIGRFQPWELRLLDAAGKPVYPARFKLGGGMPGHGHGLPTSPQVTKYLGDGRWLIEGMKLNMTGEWLLVVAVETEKSVDRVNFTFTVDY